MPIEKMIEEFAAEQDRRMEPTVNENDKELLCKFAEFVKENGWLDEDCY